MYIVLHPSSLILFIAELSRFSFSFLTIPFTVFFIVFRSIMSMIQSLDKNINYAYILGCFGLTIWTFLVSSLPLWIKISKSNTYILSIFGAGLVLGTAFSVIIPESLEPACSFHSEEASANESSYSFQQLGLSMSLGFLCMILFESITHRYHHHSHENHESASNTLLLEKKKSLHSDHNIAAKIYGLALHSVFDGFSLASGYLSKNVNTIQILFGAMIFHKTASCFGIGTFLKSSNLNFRSGMLISQTFHEFLAFRYLVLLSCSTPVSALVTAFLATWQEHLISASFIPLLFAFSSGTFVHVAVSHLMSNFGEQLTLIQMVVLTIGIILPYFFFVEH